MERTLGKSRGRIVLAVIIALAFVATCMAALTVSAALPATHPGAFDPTYNGGVLMFQPMSARTDFALSVAVQPDGKTLIAGYGQHQTLDMRIGFVTRHNADGSIDSGYANAGVRRFGDAANGKLVLDMSALANGMLLVAGSSMTGTGASQSYDAWIARLDAAVAIDPSFGTNGELLPGCAPRGRCYVQKLARQADGKLVALIGAYDPPYANLTLFLDRYLANGAPDAAFGNDGRIVLPDSVQNVEPYHLAIDAQGRFVVSGYIDSPTSAPNEGALLRFTAAGALDANFGDGGVLRRAMSNLETDFRRFDIQPDGHIVVTGSMYDPKANVRYSAFVLRVDANGVPDATFGAGGVAAIGYGYGNGVRVQADGAIVYFGQGYSQQSGLYTAMAMRLLSDGKPDLSFGPGGSVQPYPVGRFSTLTGLALGADNRYTFSGYSEQPGVNYSHTFSLRVIGTETTSNVVEFYNATLNHYFITADANEASAIDSGAAGPGWSRTGAAWKSGGPARVCRFYGSPDIDPATNARRGPNGHFYTISAEECALVKEDAGWKFESYDFSGWPMQADGNCATGSVAVKRAYNNRFAVNDSNHRYATNDAIYAGMLAQGWSGEGTVFCAPQ
jgi:uncharacterized delta-60 repeat protein